MSQESRAVHKRRHGIAPNHRDLLLERAHHARILCHSAPDLNTKLSLLAAVVWPTREELNRVA